MSQHGKSCVVPGCSREATSRGLCGSCYLAASKLVKQGRTTWEALQARGLALAPTAGRAGTGAFRKAFDAVV